MDLQSKLLPTVPCGYVLMKLQLNKFNGQIGKKNSVFVSCKFFILWVKVQSFQNPEL